MSDEISNAPRLSVDFDRSSAFMTRLNARDKIQLYHQLVWRPADSALLLDPKAVDDILSMPFKPSDELSVRATARAATIVAFSACRPLLDPLSSTVARDRQQQR